MYGISKTMFELQINIYGRFHRKVKEKNERENVAIFTYLHRFPRKLIFDLNYLIILFKRKRDKCCRFYTEIQIYEFIKYSLCRNSL